MFLKRRLFPATIWNPNNRDDNSVLLDATWQIFINSQNTKWKQSHENCQVRSCEYLRQQRLDKVQ